MPPPLTAYTPSRHVLCQGLDDVMSNVPASTLPPHRSVLVCAWGEAGASALDTATGTLHKSPSFPPTKCDACIVVSSPHIMRRVLDTLGAGDTFNAGMIVARACGLGAGDAVSFACRCDMPCGCLCLRMASSLQAGWGQVRHCGL